MRGGHNLLKLLSRISAVLSGPEAGHKCPGADHRKNTERFCAPLCSLRLCVATIMYWANPFLHSVRFH